MCLRINQLKTTRTDYLALLQQANIAADNCNYAPQGIRLQQAVAVNQLPFFSEGWVSVQDEAAQLAATLLAPQAEQRILDACCAPGGKTCHLLELEPNLGEVLALDIDEKRLERVTENLQRLQLNATLLAADAANIDSWWDQKPFDSILLDAPCSATGVIRRNPDIKLHRSEQDIQQLSQLQLEILTALWTILKPGGRILYATCSVLPQENEQVVAKFCQQQTDAKHLTINADWGIKRDFGRQLFPQANGHDGFFYALLEKPS
jgi:16S rRNA (cytosine967-C5)-methyltransferase